MNLEFNVLFRRAVLLAQVSYRGNLRDNVTDSVLWFKILHELDITVRAYKVDKSRCWIKVLEISGNSCLTLNRARRDEGYSE